MSGTSAYEQLQSPAIGNFIRRTSDGAIIPVDPTNMDYQAYLDWVAAGNTAPVVTS